MSSLSSSKAKPAPTLAPEILRYFLRNPQACDNLEGVTRWRLPDERIYEAVRTTKLALDWLVREGFLIMESRATSGDMYRLNERTLEQANRFVRAGQQKRDATQE